MGGTKTNQNQAEDWRIPESEETTDPITNPNSPTLIDPFSQLPITNGEKEKIHKLISIMGQDWVTIGINTLVLQGIGKEIQHVHPLKFLDYIFKHSQLPKSMESIGKSSLTWNPFIKGLSEKLHREASTLPNCKAGFAKSLNINLSDIEPFFSTRNWDGLAKFLIEVKLGRKTSVWIEPPPSQNPPVIQINPTNPVSEPNSAVVIPPIGSIAALSFESGDQENLRTLIIQHATYNRFWMHWQAEMYREDWEKVGEIHPLKVLTYLYEHPELMNHLKTISITLFTNALFMDALVKELSRFPLNQVRPHMNEFVEKTGLDLEETKRHIENREWKKIIDNLMLKHEVRG
jgi:hypothetical protein